jgi:chaperone BCS1
MTFLFKIAGRLELDICVLNLSSGEIDDSGLKTALREAPQRAILLLEDIDAIFVDRESVGNLQLLFSLFLFLI